MSNAARARQNPAARRTLRDLHARMPAFAPSGVAPDIDDTPERRLRRLESGFPFRLVSLIASNGTLAALILGNVVASVSIVAVNKLLSVEFGFHFVLLLSAAHFAVGWSFLRVASSTFWRLFEPKAMTMRAVVPVAVAGLASIVGMNYSLRFNSVGECIPCCAQKRGEVRLSSLDTLLFSTSFALRVRWGCRFLPAPQGDRAAVHCLTLCDARDADNAA